MVGLVALGFDSVLFGGGSPHHTLLMVLLSTPLLMAFPSKLLYPPANMFFLFRSKRPGDPAFTRQDDKHEVILTQTLRSHSDSWRLWFFSYK